MVSLAQKDDKGQGRGETGHKRGENEEGSDAGKSVLLPLWTIHVQPGRKPLGRSG